MEYKQMEEKIKKSAIILAHAFVGWVLCGLTMFIGRGITSIENALMVHAIVAPIIFSLISYFYFKKFRYITPIKTAVIFVSFVILMDFFVIALLIEKSFEMFTSILGTWIPFALIFISTYVTGKLKMK